MPAVSQDALEREVGHGVGPTVVDMSFDDTDQDEEVAMAGNRFAALSDHNSHRSEGGCTRHPPVPTVGVGLTTA